MMTLSGLCTGTTPVKKCRLAVILVTVLSITWFLLREGEYALFIARRHGNRIVERFQCVPTRSVADDGLMHRSPYPHVTKVLYNRVPKTGSETTMELMKHLSKHTHFNIIYQGKPSYAPRTVKMHKEAITRIYKRFRTESTPVIYIQHVFFPNFSKSEDWTNTAFINLVRDPLDRKISDFHYRRHRPDRPHHLTEDDMRMTLNECVESGHPECSSKETMLLMTRYFCGIDRICSSNTTAALNIAKRNIEQHYVVIGLLEQMPEFLMALECQLTQFFRGITEIYNCMSNLTSNVKNSTPQRDYIKESTRQQLRQWASNEYQLYEFIKQRFHRLIDRLKKTCPLMH